MFAHLADGRRSLRRLDDDGGGGYFRGRNEPSNGHEGSFALESELPDRMVRFLLLLLVLDYVASSACRAGFSSHPRCGVKYASGTLLWQRDLQD